MNDKLVEALKNMETHADVLMKIPANEQHIGHIQSVVSIAILEAKRAIEALAKSIPNPDWVPANQPQIEGPNSPPST